jgi:hypothetical protein
MLPLMCLVYLPASVLLAGSGLHQIVLPLDMSGSQQLLLSLNVSVMQQPVFLKRPVLPLHMPVSTAACSAPESVCILLGAHEL